MLTQWTTDKTIEGAIHIGDFAYELDSRYGRIGDKFGNLIEPIAGRLPYMGIPGNHEYKHGHNATHFRERFNMPINDVN